MEHGCQCVQRVVQVLVTHRTAIGHDDDLVLFRIVPFQVHRRIALVVPIRYSCTQYLFDFGVSEYVPAAYDRYELFSRVFV